MALQDLNDMRIFSRVVEQGGISAAARTLDMPKSKVSRRLALLEQALGIRLLERSTRSVQMTEIGRNYYLHCRRMVEESESALHTLEQLSSSPRGMLRVSASVTLGQHLLGPYLGEFLQSYPDIELELDLNNRRVDLIGEGFDLAIRVGKLADSNLISRKLGEDQAGLYASPGYLASFPQIQSAEDLHHHRLLSMSGTPSSAQWQLTSPSGDTQSLVFKPDLHINDLTLLRSLTEQGAGIMLLPGYLASQAVTEGRLVRVLPEWQGPAISFYALYPSRQGLTLKQQAWLDFFAERLSGYRR